MPARGAFEELKRLAHSMAGSAPTFGLPEVGRAARALEQALEALQAKPDGDVGEAKAKVGALRSAANAARS